MSVAYAGKALVQQRGGHTRGRLSVASNFPVYAPDCVESGFAEVGPDSVAHGVLVYRQGVITDTTVS